METIDIPKAVKEAVHRVDPGATVILYGSRARGDAQPDSDWDFLVLTPSQVNPDLKRAINHELFIVELEIGKIISCIIRQQDAWESKAYEQSEFRSNIVRDGIAV